MKADCKAIGCRNRYNCQLYQTDAEPIDYKLIIPQDHNQGDEGCPSYKPIKKITSWN